jgi:hypothetical protein
MLALIRNSKVYLAVALFVPGVLILTSCASEKQVTLVDDPDAKKKETAVPWNEQQKWEQGSAMGAAANSDRAH